MIDELVGQLAGGLRACLLARGPLPSYSVLPAVLSLHGMHALDTLSRHPPSPPTHMCCVRAVLMLVHTHTGCGQHCCCCQGGVIIRGLSRTTTHCTGVINAHRPGKQV